MDSFAEYLDYLVRKLRTNVTDPRNIIVGETKSLMGLYDESFPRCEILVDKLKFDGFQDQRNLLQSYRFSIAGYIRRHGDHPEDVTLDDMVQLISFARKTFRSVMSAHDDKLAGVPVCTGFQKIDGYPEIHLEFEMFDQISAFLMMAEIEVYLPDNY